MGVVSASRDHMIDFISVVPEAVAKMAGGRESLLIVTFLLAGVCGASELVPFIAWSNR